MIFKLLILFFAFSLYSKDYEQFIFELNQEDPDNNYVEIFEYYREYPINIYKTNSIELSRLPNISFALADEILLKINNNTWDEIKSQNKLSELEIFIIENCTNVLGKNINSYNFRSRFINNLEDKKGFVNDNFKGNKIDLYNRVGIKYQDFNFNLILNKDEGEISYADDYSINLSYNYKNNKIIVGDIRAHTGYGLLLNSGFPIRKSSNPSDVLLSFGNGFTPSRNLLALGNFRGVAYENDLLINKFRIKSRLLFSNTNRSSTINDDIVTSFYTTNLFRTENEIEKKNNLIENIIITNSEVNYNSFLIGFNYLNYKYSKILETQSQNYFTGNNGNNYSFYSRYLLNNSSINYELAGDNNNNISHLLIYNYFDTNIDFGFSYKYIHPNSRLQYNNLLTNYSTNSNEESYFSYLTIKNNNFKNTLFIDFYNRPKIDLFLDMPQSGIDIFNEFTFKLINNINFLNRIRLRNYKDFTKSNPNYFDVNRLDLRNEISYNGKIDFRIRLDLVSNEFSEDKYQGFGYLIFGEVNNRLFKSNKTSFRFTYYDTDSFNEAIWHYEYLVRGYLTAPPLYNQGYKIIFKSSIEFLKNYLLSFAFTYDKALDFDKFGSGLDEINSTQRTRLYLQLDYNLK